MQLNAAKNEIYAHKKDIARLEVLLVREKRLLSESQRALRRVTTNADRHSEMVASHDLGGHFTTTIASLQHPCTYGPATVASEDSFIVSEISDVNTPGEMKEAVFRLSFPRVARVRSRSTPTTTPPCGSPVMIERKKNVLSSASTAAP